MTSGDSKVLGDHDATMMEIGEKEKPPDKQQDLSESWARMVRGSSVGGRPNPEEVLNDEFVSARLRVEFPNGEDGQPVVTIEREVLEVMNGLWKNCMIVKALGRNINIAVLNRKLKEMWQPKGSMFVIDLPRQFFMVRFGLEEEYMAALTGGPWRAFGSYLTVQAWSSEFDPLNDNIVTTPVWVRLSNIPVNLYHKSILMGIARGLGKPIRVDDTTLNLERARYARVCVVINLAKPLKGTVLINGERYFVAYEGLSTICSRCGMYGHLVHTCPQGVTEKVADVIVPQGGSGGIVITESVDGFTEVRRTGRRSQETSNQIVFTAEGARRNESRNLREIPQITGGENIAISNRFVNLEEDRNPAELGNTINVDVEDKENHDMVNKQRISQGREQGIDVKRGGASGKPKNGLKVGPVDRRGVNKKPNEVGRQKAKGNSNRPMRGLVFGTTKGEVNLSASGKRLRVEKENAGDRGGVFATDQSGEMGSEEIRHSTSKTLTTSVSETSSRQLEESLRMNVEKSHGA